MEKNKKAYHITTAIHDSRTSARMIKYKVRKRREDGTNPYPNFSHLTAEDDYIIVKTLMEIAAEDKLYILAFNVCADHIHLLLVCELEEIPRILQKIKAVTSKNVNATREHAPLQKCNEKHAPLHEEEKVKQKNKPLWQQKYGNPKEVTSMSQLTNTIRYIQGNRRKHGLDEHPKKTQDLIDELVCTYEEAFKSENTGGFDVMHGDSPHDGL